MPKIIIYYTFVKYFGNKIVVLISDRHIFDSLYFFRGKPGKV
jgi:hypothetical protein